MVVGLCLLSFAYLLLSIKICILENGKTVQQKKILASIEITTDILSFVAGSDQVFLGLY